MIEKSIGLEGFAEYNRLAEAICFLEDTDNVEFFDFICGKDDLSGVVPVDKNIIFTIFSVYHHIEGRDKFLRELKEIAPDVTLFEMPVQKECYGGKTWEEEIAYIKSETDIKYAYFLGLTKDYNRPLVLLTKEKKISIWNRRKLNKLEEFLRNVKIREI